MASITWTCVFIFLIAELITTFILVVPVPRRFRNIIARRLIFRFHLGDSFAKIIGFIAFALILALVESYNSTMMLMEKLALKEEQDLNAGVHGHHHGHHHDKQKIYKAQRNMYLAGFALTLLFVIGRILQLMQESVELEDELEFVRGSNKPTTTNATTTKVPAVTNGKATKEDAAAEAAATTTGTEGVEMTEIPAEKKKPQDKKKD